VAQSPARAGDTLPTIDAAGAVTLPERSVPWPATASAEAKAAYTESMRNRLAQVAAAKGAADVPFAQILPAALAYTQEQVRRQNARIRAKYPVEVRSEEIAGVPVQVVTPANLPAANRDRVLINLHGGAFIFYSGSIYEAVPVAHFAQTTVIAIDYRMPPEHPFPAGLDDVIAVYRKLLERYSPGRIGIYGTSAGAALSGSSTLKIRDLKLPPPGAVALISYGSGDTLESLEGLDPNLSRFGQPQMPILEMYAGDHDAKDPLIDPSYGDFGPGFPATLLMTGTRDLLLSGTVNLHRKLRSAGVDAELMVFDGMWHGFNADMNTEMDFPEATQASQAIAEFFARRLAPK